MFVTRAFLEKRQLPRSDRLFESTGVLVFYPLLVPTPFDTFKTFPEFHRYRDCGARRDFMVAVEEEIVREPIYLVRTFPLSLHFMKQ